jgi:glycosyltransferase involved in cell wall biosynthesis
MAGDPRQRVAVIYDAFPHYRKGIIEELAASERYKYYFVGGSAYSNPSIKAYEFKPGLAFLRTRRFSLGPLEIQTNILTGLLRNGISHCIFLGNPRFLSCWMLTPVLRLLGKRVYFWSHGWIDSTEPPLRRFVKQIFFRLPHALLLYGRRSKEIGIARGFAADNMHVIGNSLDYRNQKTIFSDLAERAPMELRREFNLPLDCKIIICTARVTWKCRFDILIDAASQLMADNHRLFLLIVGDGPETGSLSALAMSLGVAHQFRSACYEETTIAKLYKLSDLTVSPGKVGLTAMHSLAYGTPVISHNNFDNQMPECEAIVPGVTGDFFLENSSKDLARTIARWFDAHPVKPELECIRRVEIEFTPALQRRAIENALEATA